jgi:uncharacterized protein
MKVRRLSPRMIIPYKQISSDALRGLIEEYITREGTDYGEQEFLLEQKVAQIEQHLNRGEVVVVFDIATETVSLLNYRDAKTLQHLEDRE